MAVFNEKVLLVFAISSLLLLLVSLGLVYFSFDDLGRTLVLHFDGLEGVDWFGEKSDLWFIWATGAVIVGLNFFLGNVFFYRERVLTYLLLGGGLLVSIFLLVALGQIISLN